MNISKFAALVLALCLSPRIANAEVLNFDDLSYLNPPVDQYLPIPNGYGGVDWNNFFVYDSAGKPTNGESNDVISSPDVSFNGFGNPATISKTISPFTLNNGYFAGTWRDGLIVTVVGQVGGVNTYSKTFSVDTQSPQFETFDWTNLNAVTFSSAGGTVHGYNGQGYQFALDNLTLTVPGAVPEPATWAMMLAGFAVVGSAMRRRARVSFALA